MVTRVRLLEPADIYAVLAIETEANPSPWKAPDFSAFLESQDQSQPTVGGDRKAWVYADPEVRGFLCAVGVAEEAELQSVAVERVRWGEGVGASLMEAFIAWAKAGRYRILHLEVREGNIRALDFYRRWGFAAVGRRPRYYRDNGEDAILMSLTL
jgi:[ribosomal protein S18]-alanine N-acetyltransferase